MKTLFNSQATDSIVQRIHNLQPGIQPLWGKMNASQMLAHCHAGFEGYFGDIKMKRPWFAFILGPIAKRSLYSKKPWGKNLPTAREMIFTNDPEFNQQRELLLQKINRFTSAGRNQLVVVHPFFGKMTADEWGVLFYRHLDHHLSQFGA